MNRKDLEEMFEEKVTSTRIYDEYWIEITDEIKQFIFNEMLTEIFKDIIDDYWSYDGWCWCCSTYTLEEKLIKDVKEFYNITL